MSDARWSGPGWPEPVQEHLLQAVAGDSGSALEAWSRWRSLVDLDDVDHPSMRLLPLAHRRLAPLVEADSDMARIKGIYRKSWTANQLLIGEVAPAVDELRGAGLEVIALKGAALAVTHYRDVGARWFRDVDLLVRGDEADRAHDLLVAAGWRPHHGRPGKLMATDHGSAYEKGSALIDLHWRSSWLPAPDDDVWAAAVPIELGGVGILAPGASDQILQACVHGATWLPSLQLHWLADIATVVRADPGAVDWDRFVARAKARHVVPWAREGIAYVSERLGVAVPEPTLRALAGAPVPRADRAAYRLTMRPPSLPRTLKLAWHTHRRHAALDVPGPRANGYVSWLQRASGYERRRDLFRHGVRRLARSARPGGAGRSGA